MKRKLAIEIDCGDKTCDGCGSIQYPETEIYPVCGNFGKSLTDDKPLRLLECLAAEGEIARLEDIEGEHKAWNNADCNTCPLREYEACDEICASKLAMAEKLAELLKMTEVNR